MNKHPHNTVDHRKCTRCKNIFAATAEFFIKDKSRPGGIAYECKECHRKRKAGRDNRNDRWGLMTDEQRNSAKIRNRRYGRTDKGRACSLRNTYNQIDKCDLTTAEVFALIVQPCLHCGTTETPRGLDRIDNNLPHIKGNVVPSCAPCNFARGDRFSFEEMKEIGAVIRKIIKDRLSKKAENAVHP